MILEQEVDFMENLMRETARIEILPRFGKVVGEIKERYKDFKEVVTKADTESSSKILKVIREKFPGSYSEEELFDDRFDNDLIWQLDPVDGTSEFCAGMIDGYAMHAALLKRDVDKTYLPIAGIIYLPGVNRSWNFDGKELSFSKDGKKVELPRIDNKSLRGYIRKVDPNKEVSDFYEMLGKRLAMPSKTIESGGSGSSFSDLLEGKLNIIVMNYDYTKEWDLAMAEPLVKARGGWICDLEGDKFTYNRKDQFNRKGYVASIVFSKDEVMKHISLDLLINKL